MPLTAAAHQSSLFAMGQRFERAIAEETGASPTLDELESVMPAIDQYLRVMKQAGRMAHLHLQLSRQPAESAVAQVHDPAAKRQDAGP